MKQTHVTLKLVVAILLGTVGRQATIQPTAADDHRWRVPVLDNESAGKGLPTDPPRETLIASWTVKAPGRRVEGAQFSLVYPQPGPWRVWCNRDKAGTLKWHVETRHGGKWSVRTVKADPPKNGGLKVEVVMEPRAITLQFGGKAHGRFFHDSYGERFGMRFTSRQTREGGPAVASEFREASLTTFATPTP